MKRIDLPKLLNEEDPIGIELGVKGGGFSVKLIECYNFKKFYMIDVWDSMHTYRKYKYKQHILHLNNYLRMINYSKNCTKTDVIPLRGYFKDFFMLFDDQYFDFIYIDGDAESGQEKGQTIRHWLPKLKLNGIISGHDYYVSGDKYPLTKHYVDLIAKENNLKVNMIGATEANCSWYYTK